MFINYNGGRFQEFKMTETEERKFCFHINYPTKFLCCLSLEFGVLALAVILILLDLTIIGRVSYHLINGQGHWETGELDVVTVGFYIQNVTRQAFFKSYKWPGGFHIAVSLLTAISAIMGLVGIQRKKPAFVFIFECGVGLLMGYWTPNIIVGWAVTADDLASVDAWTLIILFAGAILLLGFYFLVCIEALFIKIRSEKKEKQMPEEEA